MKRQKAGTNIATVRTTVVLSEPQDFYLGLAALETRRSKGEIVREAVSAYLTSQHGIADPETLPDRVEVKPHRFNSRQS